MSNAHTLPVELLKGLVEKACNDFNQKECGHEYDPESIAERFESFFLSKVPAFNCDPSKMTSWEEDFDKAWAERKRVFDSQLIVIWVSLCMAIFKEEGKADYNDKHLKNLLCRFASTFCIELAKALGFNYTYIQTKPTTFTYGYEDKDGDITIERVDYHFMVRHIIMAAYELWYELEVERMTIEKITEGDINDKQWLSVEYTRSLEAAGKFFDEDILNSRQLREFWEARYSRHPKQMEIVRLFDTLSNAVANDLLDKVQERTRALCGK